MAIYRELPNQNRLSGINTLAYMGTEASTPPQFVIEKRAPTPNDLQNWRIGTIWLLQNQGIGWMLVAKTDIFGVTTLNAPNYATWVQMIPGSVELKASDGNIADPINGIIQVLGGLNMNTTAIAPAGDTITIDMIAHPVISGLTFSSFVGGNSNILLTDTSGVVHASSGTDHQILMSEAAGPGWVDLTSTGGTVVLTYPGDNTINFEAIGGGGGGVSSLIGDDAGVATPTLLGQITIAGDDVIRTVAAAPANTVTISIEDSPPIGNNIGYVVMGQGPGVDSAWGYLTSTDLSVAITPTTDGGGIPIINFTVAGGAGGFAGLLDQNNVTAVPDISHKVQVTGDANIATSAAGSVLTVGLNLSGGAQTPGAVLIGGPGGPVWGTITGGGGITVTNTNNHINITGGGGGTGGITTIITDSNTVVDPGTHVISMNGAAGYSPLNDLATFINIRTSDAVAGGSAMQIALSDCIQLHATSPGGTSGIIQIYTAYGTPGLVDMMHNLGTSNAFFGGAGNRTFSVPTCTGNTALGYRSLDAMVSECINNTSVGYQALTSLSTPSVHSSSVGSTAYGFQALKNLSTGYACTGLGFQAGAALGTQANVLCIGDDGTGAVSGDLRIGLNFGGVTHNTLKTYISGIAGNAVANAAPVFINTVTGQLGSGASFYPTPAYGTVYVNATTDGFLATPVGVSGQVLTSQGAGAPPIYANVEANATRRFLANLGTTINNINANGVTWRFGTNDNGATGNPTFTQIFNDGGNTLVLGAPGTGTPFKYVFVTGGLYSIGATLNLTVPANGLLQQTNTLTVRIYNAAASNYQSFQVQGPNYDDTVSTDNSIVFSTIYKFTAGDYITLEYDLLNLIGGTYTVKADPTTMATWVYGYQLA
jgi:hypothetical protein